MLKEALPWLWGGVSGGSLLFCMAAGRWGCAWMALGGVMGGLAGFLGCSPGEQIAAFAIPGGLAGLRSLAKRLPWGEHHNKFTK